jgi:hypothetical protein
MVHSILRIQNKVFHSSTAPSLAEETVELICRWARENLRRQYVSDGEIDECPKVIPGSSTPHRGERARGGVETESPLGTWVIRAIPSMSGSLGSFRQLTISKRVRRLGRRFEEGRVAIVGNDGPQDSDQEVGTGQADDLAALLRRRNAGAGASGNAGEASDLVELNSMVVSSSRASVGRSDRFPLVTSTPDRRVRFHSGIRDPDEQR